jgi:hypothetical protein
MGSSFGRTGQQGQMGCERLSAWIWLFSSTQRTTARSGGSKYKPTTSRSVSMNNGSVDSLKLSARCGLSSKACQIRRMVVGDMPVALAIEQVDQ